jgi:D-amino-acid dehydrogenase
VPLPKKSPKQNPAKPEFPDKDICMKVLVLGAGIIGTSSAWYLSKAGHDVTVVERQNGAALETSFANGGQISVSHAEPWANPSAPMKVLKWLGQEDAPLLFRLRPELLQWCWGLQFLRECTAERTAHNIRQIFAMAEYGRLSLQALRAETGIQYDSLCKGILHFYTDEQDFEASLPAAKLMRDLGCPRMSIGRDEVLQIEPALAHIKEQIVGADYTATDESGDVHQFTRALAEKAAGQGVQFRYNTSITRLLSEGRGSSARICGIEVIDQDGRHQRMQADAYVIALGSFSVPLLKPLGIHLMIYPGKGYSATYPILQEDKAPTVSLSDDASKLVFSRLGKRLRVAGTCELNGYTRELNDTRCAALTARTSALFPEVCDYTQAAYWTGLRPLTPSNIPYIGKSRYCNLFLNTGHGTLGWTMGAGSGRAIADIVNGKIPEPNFNFSGLAPRS